MFFIDDLRILSVFTWLHSIQLLSHPLQISEQLFSHTFVYKHIIRCHTSLTCIQKFSPHNPFCCQFQIGCLINNTRTFSAKFQTDRSQMLCCFLHHILSNFHASCKKDIVKSFVQQTLILLSSTFYAADISRYKKFLRHLLHQPGDIWGIGGWL